MSGFGRPSSRATVSCSCGARATFESITSSAVDLQTDRFYAAHAVCRLPPEPPEAMPEPDETVGGRPGGPAAPERSPS